MQDGRVVFDQMLGHCIVRSTWEKRDAKIIADMIAAAADETGEQKEVVTSSGLTIASELPT